MMPYTLVRSKRKTVGPYIRNGNMIIKKYGFMLTQAYNGSIVNMGVKNADGTILSEPILNKRLNKAPYLHA